jgi:hypothetical protein
MRSSARAVRRVRQSHALVPIRNSGAVRSWQQIGTYIGMIPTEDSSADKQRLGHHCQSSDASQDGHSLGLDVAKRLSIRHRSSSVRARDSSVPGMVCSKTSR